MTQIPQVTLATSFNKTPGENPRRHNQQRGRAGGGSGRGKNNSQSKQGGVTFPWINGQIVAAAETGNIHSLVYTISTYLPQMNLVNMSTGLHRLAKLSNNNPAAHALLKQGLLPQLLGSTQQALMKAQLSGSLPKCQALSNITWALATMHVVDLPLLHLVAQFSHWQLSNFKNFELCQLLWAFAKLGTMTAELCHSTAGLFLLAGEYVMRNIDHFTFRGLVMTAWAFATARHNEPRLFKMIADHLLIGLHSANCQELANTAWSFATAGVHQEHLFEMLAKESIPRLVQFKPQELSSMLWSFAAIGNQADDLYVAASRVAMGMELQSQQLANILWAITKMRPRHVLTQEVVLNLLPRCTRLLETFKPQELASVALAAGKSFGKTDQEPMMPVHVKVQNYFQRALPQALPKLHEYSAQSLANLTSSLLSLQIGMDSDFFEYVGLEIVSRPESSFENSALLLLLKTLPQVPSTNNVRSAIGLLFTEAAHRADKLPVREFHILSRICAKLRGDDEPTGSAAATWESRQELQVWCLALARSGGKPQQPKKTTGYEVKTSDTMAARSWLDQADIDHHILINADEDPGNNAEKWGSTLVVAASSQAASAWDAEANQQLRQVVETTGALREEQARERGDALENQSSVEETQAPQFVVSVKNTFLELEEPADQGDGEDEPELNLPPALTCIPDSVSPKKLAAYRTQYARFRVGSAIGAKGELDAVS